MKSLKFSRFLVPLCAFMLSSCNDDSVGKVSVPPVDTDPGCTNSCENGVWECYQDGYRSCQKGDSGCYEWQVNSCPEDTTCDAESKKCKGAVDCENACEDGAWECTEDGYRSCEMADSGCFEWVNTPCDENTHCDAEEKTCVDDSGDSCQKCTAGAHRCEGTLIASCEEDEVTGCTSWNQPASCGEGMYCDAESSDCIEGCMDECKEGESQCVDMMIQKCGKSSETGCMAWGSAESCGENMHCDDTTHTCVEGCVDECTEGSVSCDGTFLMHCGNYDSDSCLEFGDSQECTNNTTCSVEAKGCVSAGCDTECTLGNQKCSSDEIQECKPVDGTSCNEYVTVRTCNENETCTESGAKAECVKGCSNECTIGAVKCDNNNLMTCVEESGCPVWKQTKACAAGTYCSADKKDCIDQCPDECTLNATQCSGNGVQTCIKQSNGCNGWGSAVACGTAQSCKNGKCEYNCGTDCEPFSIVIIPDTQNYTGHKNKKDGKVYDRYGKVVDGKSTSTIYHKQMQWIADNRNTAKIPNLKMVIHMGDITNDNDDVQWKIAKSAQDILKKAGIPFTVVNGNHDYRGEWNGSNGFKLGSRSGTKYSEYFPESYLKTLPGYGGIYSKVNTYFNFKAGGQDFMVLNLEFAPRQQTLCWANDLLQKPENKNKKVIMATHGNLTHEKDNKAKYCGRPTPTFVPIGSSGQEIWDGFSSRHPNLFMVLSGHVGDSEHYIKKSNVKNHSVAEILTDYQFDLPCAESKLASCKSTNGTEYCGHKPDGGNGWLRVLTFDPKTNKVKVKIYTTLTDTTLRKKTFSGENKEVFFCGTPYTKDGDSHGPWYNSDPTNAEHQYEFELDFTSAISGTYNANNYLGFTHQVINKESSGDQINSSVAANNTGNMVFVWEDDSSNADGNDSTGKNAHDIHGRIFKPGGCFPTADIVINADTAGHQYDPDVAMDKDGNFVVVWTDDTDNNGSTQVYMRGFKADGSQRWARKVVNSVKTRDQYQARIAMAADGTFAVSWTDTREAKDKPQIWVRGFKADGSELFAERAVADTAAGERIKSDIFMDDSKNIVVTWQDDNDGNGTYQIYMRLLKADGTNKTKVLTVNSDSAGQQAGPSIGGKRDGSKFIISWTNYAKGADKYDIMARTFDANGKQIDKDFTASTTAGKNQNSQVCMDNNGNAVIAWYNKDKRDIMRRFFVGSATAGKADTIMNWPVNASGKNDQGGHAYQPAVACISGTKNWAVYSYSDDWDNNSKHEIYGFSEQLK